MKSFVIDQGNTVTKLAVFDKGQITEVKRFSDPNAQFQIQDYILSQDLKNGIVCSVRKNKLVLGTFENSVLEFSHATKLFFKLDYKTPNTLGLDRIANAAAVIKMSTGNNHLIVDFGTCTTYSLVTNGVFVGGAISPGLGMRYRALSHYTAGLPLVDMSQTALQDVIGKSTEGSIKAGVEAAGLLEIDAMIEKYCSLYSELNVIGTGGNMPFFESHLKSTIFAVPNLTLLGLYEYNEF